MSRSLGTGNLISELHRLLPQAYDAECALLSAFLIDPDYVGPICEERRIHPGHFHSSSLAQLFEEIVFLHNEHEPIDIVTLTQRLGDQNKLNELKERVNGCPESGASLVTALFVFLPTACNAEYYAGIVIEKYLLRYIINNCTEIVARCYEEQGELPEHIQSIEKLATRLVALAQGQSGPQVDTRELMREIVEEFKRGDTKAMFGRPTGFAKLDEHLGGFCDTDLIVIAGPTSSGKTAFALQIEDYWANIHQVRVIDFTFEMKKKQKAKRLLQLRSGINLRDALRKHPELGDTTIATLERTVANATHAPEFIDERGWDITRCVSELRRLHMQSPVGMAVLDYDLLIRGEAGEKGEREVASIAKCWKNAASEMNCVAILLSQVTIDSHGNTKMKWSEGKRDFANTLLEISDLDDGGKSVSIRKQRDGERFRSVHFDFDGKTTRFTERVEQPD